MTQVEMRPYVRGVLAKRTHQPKDTNPYDVQDVDRHEDWSCGWDDQNILMNRGIMNIAEVIETGKDNSGVEAQDATSEFESSQVPTQI
jgi:hypothetical protein